MVFSRQIFCYAAKSILEMLNHVHFQKSVLSREGKKQTVEIPSVDTLALTDDSILDYEGDGLGLIKLG